MKASERTFEPRLGDRPDRRQPLLTRTLIDELKARTPASAAAHRQASLVLPGGETRSVTSYAPYPIVITSGDGAILEDLDGHLYCDLVSNYTSLAHGNAFKPALARVADLMPGGVAFASPHPAQIELAQLLVDRVPSVDLVRFTNSGTEASILAARIAAHATKRPRLLRFEKAYHGSAASLSSGPDVVEVPWNDIDAVGVALRDDPQIGAVFAEPFLGAAGVLPAEPGFLKSVQALAQHHGALFVLDEVQSLRIDLSGEQGRQDLQPDLTVLGKIIGGGLPIGAVGGRADLLTLTSSRLTPNGVEHNGTFNGHVAAAAAGAATLEALDQAAIEGINAVAETLARQIEGAAVSAGLDVLVTRAGSIMHVHMPSPEQQQALHLALLLSGVYAAPRGMINISTAVTDTNIAAVERAYHDAFQRLAGDG